MATEYKLSYTANDINDRLGKIDRLAEKSELPLKLSELTNDSGFATETYVKNYAQPMGDYALNSDIPEIPVHSVNGKIGDVSLNAFDVGALPDTTEIPTVPTNVSVFINDAGYLTEHQSLDGYATETYVDDAIAAIPTPDVSTQIAAHNTLTTAHSDIRDLITGLTTRLNTLADSDDTTLDQMSEIVAYIKANKDLIDSITTSKVNVSDIIDNLTTNVTNKPLSAAQGVALKALIDDKISVSSLSDAVNDALTQAKESGEFDGENGADGVSATHSWNGTTLTITSASGTSSANLKGDKGDKGEDGYAPVRGTDYWTDADKAEIKSYVDEAILNGEW